MKRLIAIALSLAFLLTLAGCANKPDGVNDTPKLDEISAYTQKQLEEKLIGLSEEAMHSAWGEPDGILFGFWGDIWRLGDECDGKIILYYDKDGTVENIICSLVNEETVSNEIE